MEMGGATNFYFISCYNIPGLTKLKKLFIQDMETTRLV